MDAKSFLSCHNHPDTLIFRHEYQRLDGISLQCANRYGSDASRSYTKLRQVNDHQLKWEVYLWNRSRLQCRGHRSS
jgi:hypothetical protein